MLGKINNEEILYLNVVGIDQGWQDRFKSIKEAYDYIQKAKQFDKQYNFKETAYLIEIETAKNIYTYYQIRKYKNKYKLVYCNKY